MSAWLDVFERLYLAFRLKPYVSRRTRSLTKEHKLYLRDWSQIEDPAARFENLIASHLLKSDISGPIWGTAFDLAYVRDRDKREVDFVVTERRRPVALIECKLADETPSSSLEYLGDAIGPMAKIQVIRKAGIDRAKGTVRVVSADRFLAGMC